MNIFMYIFKILFFTFILNNFSSNESNSEPDEKHLVLVLL